MQVSKQQLEQLKQDVKVEPSQSTRGQGFGQRKAQATPPQNQPGDLAKGTNRSATHQARTLKDSVITARQEFDALAEAAAPAIQDLIDGTYLENALARRLTPVRPDRFQFGAFSVPSFGQSLPPVDVDALFLPSGNGSTD